MPRFATVDEYIASFPEEVRERLEGVRAAIHVVLPDGEERIRYDIAAVMLGGRYALHFAGWKHHIGLYPVPAFDGDLESRLAPYRVAKDSINFKHSAPVPYDLVTDVTRAIVDKRGQADG
jgi:uncharacterized protein YdhG (YjbR/CyaY superfamily)